MTKLLYTYPLFREQPQRIIFLFLDSITRQLLGRWTFQYHPALAVVRTVTRAGKTLAIFTFFHSAAQVRADQADSNEAFVSVLNYGGDIQPDDLMAFWVIVLWSQVEFGWWAGVWLIAEKAEQSAQAE